MTPTPTGRRETRDGRDAIVYERTFHAPIAAVWAAVTESDRLARWVGEWTGDPSTGSVMFRMNAEGDEVQAEAFTIERCEPPHVLEVTTPAPDGGDFGLLLELAEDAGTTTLTFCQFMPDLGMATDIGPGWEYYLDRLVAAETGRDVAALDFDDYYPAQREHYRDLFS